MICAARSPGIPSLRTHCTFSHYYNLLKYKGVALAEETAEGGSFHATARDGFSIPIPPAAIGPGPWGFAGRLRSCPRPQCDGGFPQLGTRGPVTHRASTGKRGWGEQEGLAARGERELASHCPAPAGWAGRSTARASRPLGNWCVFALKKTPLLEAF